MAAECRVTRGGELVGDQLLDASATGVRVRALAEVRLRETVELALRLPGSKGWVVAAGEVTRRVHGRRADDDGPSFGIRLRRIGPLERHLLASVSCWFERAEGTREGPDQDRE